jgi:hypothetical protein
MYPEVRILTVRLVGPLIRFYAHLVLALRTMGESVPDLAANAILQAYLKVLEMEGNDHLVAAYAACLRQGSGEESYARFLRCKYSESLFSSLTLMTQRWTRTPRRKREEKLSSEHVNIIWMSRVSPKRLFVWSWNKPFS